jgi:hypothetical protein
MVAQVLLHFEGELCFAHSGNIEIHRDSVINGREALGELDIHDRPDDLDNFAFIHVFIQRVLPDKSGESKNSGGAVSRAFDEYSYVAAHPIKVAAASRRWLAANSGETPLPPWACSDFQKGKKQNAAAVRIATRGDDEAELDSAEIVLAPAPTAKSVDVTGGNPKYRANEAHVAAKES